MELAALCILHQTGAARFVRRGLAIQTVSGHNAVIEDSQNMRLRVGCEFDYRLRGARADAHARARRSPTASITTLYESRWTEPEVPVREYVDAFGNHCWRFVAPPGRFRIRYDALVAIAGEPDLVVPDAPLVPVEDLPDETLVFTLPSRYIQSDLLMPDRLGPVRQHAADLGARAGRLRLGPRQHQLRDRQQRPDDHGHGRLRAPRRRLPRLRAARDGASAAR